MKLHPDYNNLLQFKRLDKEQEIEHFCTTRKGGVSSGAFSSFNFGNFSDDDPLDIYENRQILSRMWYMDVSSFIVPHQTHSNNVMVIDEEFLKHSQHQKNELLYGVDASITHLKDVFLCATTADCVPVLLYDKKREIVAAIHAGWKGIVGKIINNTIAKMAAVYDSDAADIMAAVGPCISQKHYEVGDDLIDKFEKAGFDLTSVTFKHPQTNKWHINLREIVSKELINVGLNKQHIEVSDKCTFEEKDLFFSARRQTIHCGRMLSGIKLEDLD